MAAAAAASASSSSSSAASATTMMKAIAKTQHALDTSQVINVAFLTAGGLAPCLSSSIAQFVQAWTDALATSAGNGNAAAQGGGGDDAAKITFRMYRNGYKGLLTGDSFLVPPEEYSAVSTVLNDLGGSPIGASRVKLTNLADCVKHGYVPEGSTPLDVAAQQLLKDKVHVLHTIGGDDTNTQAATLAAHISKLEAQNPNPDKHHVIVIGMPKTIDNDVYPIVQTLGAHTAAVQGAAFFNHVVNECTANPRMLILHECMGRDSGYLTAATAREYRQRYVQSSASASNNNHSNNTNGHSSKSASALYPASFPYPPNTARDIHAVWIPELTFDLHAEGDRLKKILDEVGCVNIFFGEGTGLQTIVQHMERSQHKDVPRDAFGHVCLSQLNPGAYFAKHLAEHMHAEKTLVQKSGYFARSAPADIFDKELIGLCAKAGVQAALAGVSGCMGQDEDVEGHPIRAIEFERIKGGKPFDITQEWFVEMMRDIGQGIEK